MTQNFYHDLEAFQQFEDFTRSENYQPLPDDWVIVIADIKDSTRAIDEGHYKEVNLIGAACITQAMLAMQTLDIPFVFGGDGASLCIPRDQIPVVSQQLGKLQQLAQQNYDLELRVAIIPMTAIRNRRKKVLVAKLEITAGRCIALFRGGGLAEADTLAKLLEHRYSIQPVNETLDSLAGLSCRWSPIPSRKGHMVSLLVMARDSEAMEVYQALINSFRQVMGREIADANPVQDNLVQYKTIGQALREEASYHRSRVSLSFMARCLDILLSVLIYRYGINPLGPLFKAGQYKDTISTHSDFRKFDDTLRLIMDCTPGELGQLQELLERGYKQGHLYYGLYTSDSALMTCFVETTQQGDHLHFIDGGDGGLAMASRQLKKQMSGN